MPGPPAAELEERVWRALEHAHEERVDLATSAHLARRRAGRSDPVEDFLFTYYPFRPAYLRRWHPGSSIRLDGASERAAWKHYAYDGQAAFVDTAAFLARHGDTVAAVHRLLEATTSRPASLRCFGLHEWAMVYRLDQRHLRHPSWPLRLGASGTDDVVASHHLRCTHFDAYRFFTPEAAPRNTGSPQADSRVQLEQPGCLHATMDLYKQAARLLPLLDSTLVMDCFDLARDVRVVDMRASPYDLSGLGYEPIAVETAAGKAEYVAAQRRFAERAAPLRERLIRVCRAAVSTKRQVAAG